MNIKSLLPLLILVLITGITMDSCRHDSVAVEGPFPTIYFTNDVLPIFQTNCATTNCHDGAGNVRLVLNNYDGIIMEVQNGSPQGSRVYTAITTVYGGGMPPKKPLTESQRTVIRLWILEGALNNTKPDTTIQDTTAHKTVVQSYPVCFSRDILPIITSNCSSCHNGLKTYSSISQLVSAGNPSGSSLYRVINGSGEDRMPPSGQLSQSNIDSIYNWILAGAKNENCPALCDTTKFTFSGQVSQVISTNCSGCHSGASAQKGVQLVDYTTISAAAKNGTLMNDLKHINNGFQMPPTGPLSECDITVIQNWVNAGEPNN